jgi:Oxidoreductase molybdopterin binding domain
MIALCQNRERLMPATGYPKRLLLPGYEGYMNVQYLRRIGGHSVWPTRRFLSVAWGPERDALSFLRRKQDAARTGCAPPALSGPLPSSPSDSCTRGEYGQNNQENPRQAEPSHPINHAWGSPPAPGPEQVRARSLLPRRQRLSGSGHTSLKADKGKAPAMTRLTRAVKPDFVVSAKPRRNN